MRIFHDCCGVQSVSQDGGKYFCVHCGFEFKERNQKPSKCSMTAEPEIVLAAQDKELMKLRGEVARLRRIKATLEGMIACELIEKDSALLGSAMYHIRKYREETK